MEIRLEIILLKFQAITVVSFSLTLPDVHNVYNKNIAKVCSSSVPNIEHYDKPIYLDGDFPIFGPLPSMYDIKRCIW